MLVNSNHSSSNIDDKLFNYLINNVYDCIKDKHLEYEILDEKKVLFLEKKINNYDKKILDEMILGLSEHFNEITKENIYIASIYYYYASIVIDEECLMFNIIDIKKNYIKEYFISDKFFNIRIDVDACWSIIDSIISSDEFLFSYIRKLVNFYSSKMIN